MRSTFAAALAVLCLALFLGACSPESVDSSLTVNGSTYGPDRCKTLFTSALFGVELIDDRDVAVRIAEDIDDSVTVVVVDGVHPLEKLEHCASVQLNKDLESGGSYTVSGHASLECDGANVSIHGTADFGNCNYEY